MKTIGGRILQLMKKCNYTQKELAGMVGVTESAMSRYLNNEREPKLEVIANLATALNTTSDYIIRGRESAEDFADVYRLVARSTCQMTESEKMRLVRLLIGND